MGELLLSIKIFILFVEKILGSDFYSLADTNIHL